MIVLLVAALGSGLAALAVTWPLLGPWALLLAPAVASAAGLLAGLILAVLRRDKPFTRSLRVGVSNATKAEPAANDSALSHLHAS